LGILPQPERERKPPFAVVRCSFTVFMVAALGGVGSSFLDM
jgi:hypothetical protein